jgi:sulfate adenylyltransferase
MKKSNDTVELNSPYGGQLIDLLVTGAEREDLARRAGQGTYPAALARAVLCDLELLAMGGFSPLDRFMGKADYDQRAEQHAAGQRADLVHPDHPAGSQTGWHSRKGRRLALRNANNNLIAWMRVDEIFEADPHEEAAKGLGCADEEHPTYREMLSWGKFRLSGPLKVLEMPQHFDFPELRRTPAQGARVACRRWAIPMWWLFRPAIPCIARMKNSPSARPRNPAPTCCSTRWSA